MFELVKWNDSLNLSTFYKYAEKRGFVNNSSQQKLVDCINNEKEKQVWILLYNSEPVGSVAAHSIDVFGDNSYRICARTCILTDLLPIKSLRTIRGIIEHQNYTSQFFIPTCIEWAGKDKNLFITSNSSKEASQRLVHEIFCPTLEKKGILEFHGNVIYRGLEQSFWKLDVDKFYEDLNRFTRWTYKIGT
jgi:hypothetical protein